MAVACRVGSRFAGTMKGRFASCSRRQGSGKVPGQARRLCNLTVALAPFWLPLLLDAGMKALVGLRAAPPAPQPVTWLSPAAWEVALLAP